MADRAGFDPLTPVELALDGEKSCGAALLDLEGDGDWDLVVPDDDETSGVRLLRNEGAFDAWTDITSSHAPGRSVGSNSDFAAVGDRDADGDIDVVTRADRHSRRHRQRQRRDPRPTRSGSGRCGTPSALCFEADAVMQHEFLDAPQHGR